MASSAISRELSGIESGRYNSSDGMEDMSNVNPEDVVQELHEALSQRMYEQEKEERKRKAARKLVTLLFQGSPIPTDSEGRMKRIMYRFRALARLMLSNRIAPALGHIFQENYEKGQTASNLPVFNLSAYKKVQKAVQLAPMIKKILLKPPEFRREEESELVYKNLCQLVFFNQYSQQTLFDMAQVLNYQYLEGGRVVVKQGQMPLAYYIVLSGVLVVSVDERAEEANKIITRTVAELMSGDTFGELALIHNTPRTATITTKYSTELLWLDRDDFNRLLKANAEHEWQGRFITMSSFSSFNSWSPEQIQACSNNSKLLTFDNDSIILGNVVGRPEHLYFITSGKCKVVEVLRLLTENVTTYSKQFKLQMASLHLPSAELLLTLAPWQRLVRRYLHMMTLGKGQFFGAGEDLQRRYVVAWGKTECIQIPHVFLRRHNHADWVELLQDTMQAALPSHSFVFNEFVERATWRAYKRSLLQDLVSRSKKPVLTQLEDVPLSVRQAEERENWNTVQNK